jgi:uncharacterized membrane protein SpoIIM required for sporulation
MKETRFIAQNKEKWREAETLLDSPVKDPEKLSNLFIQVVDDLSYSRTFYPNRSVRVYLNKIARQYFSIISGHKKEKHNQFKLFWLEELPQIIIFSRRQLLISLLVFLIALAIGVFSSLKDPQFTGTILGEGYVAMTNKNIQRGDPMAVYKQSQQIDMFLGITFNNLMVAFRTYVLGVFFGIGTLGSLLYNGIMVGSFQYYFVERGLFLESSLSIWLHGTLEISSIILAGGAGLTLSSGLLFPGTYSRLQSLQISGMRSLKLMLGIAPVFVLAAIIESFLTRYTDAPMWLKIALIFLSASFIVGYFIVYPWMKYKNGFTAPLKETRLPPTGVEPVNFGIIKTNADILKETFQFYSRNNASLFSLAFLVAAGTSVAFLFVEQDPYIIKNGQWWVSLLSDMFFALRTPALPFIFVNGLGASLIIYRVMKLIDAESRKITITKDSRSFLQTLVIVMMIYALIYLGAWGIVVAMISFGVLIFVAFVKLNQTSGLAHAINVGWDLFRKNNNQGLSLQFMVVLLSFGFLLVLSAPLLYIHLTVLKWNFVPTDQTAIVILNFLELLIKTFCFYLVLPIVAASISYLYFSQSEVSNAGTLKESIAKMGQLSRKR